MNKMGDNNLINVLEIQLLNGAVLLHYLRKRAFLFLGSEEDYLQRVDKMADLFQGLELIKATAWENFDAASEKAKQWDYQVDAENYEEKMGEVKKDVKEFLSIAWSRAKKSPAWEQTMTSRWVEGKSIEELTEETNRLLEPGLMQMRATWVVEMLFNDLRELWKILPNRDWKDEVAEEGEKEYIDRMILKMEEGIGATLDEWKRE